MNERYYQRGIALEALMVMSLFAACRIEGAVAGSFLGTLFTQIQNGGSQIINFSAISAAVVAIPVGAYKITHMGPRNFYRDYVKGYFSSDRTIGHAHAQSNLKTAYKNLNTALDNRENIAPYQANLDIARAVIALHEVYTDVIRYLAGDVDTKVLEAQRNEIEMNIIRCPQFMPLLAQAAQHDPGLRRTLANAWQSAHDLVALGTTQAMHQTFNGASVPAINRYAAAAAWAKSGADASEMASDAIVGSGEFLFNTARKTVQKALGKVAPQTMSACAGVPTTRTQQLQLLQNLNHAIVGQQGSWFEQVQENLWKNNFFDELLTIMPGKPEQKAVVMSHARTVPALATIPAAQGVLVATEHAAKNSQVVHKDIIELNDNHVPSRIVQGDALPERIHPMVVRMYALLAKTKTMDPIKAAQYGLVITTGVALTMRNFSVLTGAGARVWNAWVDMLDCVITTSCRQVASAGSYAYSAVAGKKAHDQKVDAENESENDAEIAC